MNEEKWKLFLEVARTLNCRGATPLLYGSLGLWHRTGEIFRLSTFCEKKQGGKLYTVVFSPKIV